MGQQREKEYELEELQNMMEEELLNSKILYKKEKNQKKR